MTPTPAQPWVLDPAVSFLNHGSFGACPAPVLEAQAEWRARMEAEPVRFLARELDGLLADVRGALGRFVGADPDDLALVPNATVGINTVLHSLRFEAGEELLAIDHEYNASLNALREAARRDGANVVVARVPFPIAEPAEALEAIVGAVTARTRLALVDHITSPTALVLPIDRIVGELNERGVPVLVDGAHGPGMVPLDLEALGADYYAGNCHKWLCAPKGSAFLHVRRERRAAIRPLAISHGANDPRIDRSRFRVEFDWTGTIDPTPFLAIPAAIETLGALLPGGWPELMAANRHLALCARRVLAAALEADLPAPDSMIGAMAALPLPRLPQPGSWTVATAEAAAEQLGRRLFDEHCIEVPAMPWPAPRLARDRGTPPDAPVGALVRVSAQHYNSLPEYERLAVALRSLLGLD